MSVLHPRFAEELLTEFRALVVYLQLKPPAGS